MPTRMQIRVMDSCNGRTRDGSLELQEIDAICQFNSILV